MSTARGTTIVCLIVITSVLASCSGVSAAEGESGQGASIPVTLLEAYQVDILGSYAITRVTRVMVNPTEEAVEHTFTFRIPEGALISGFSIEVNGTTYEAAVLEKEAAQATYNTAMSAGRTAGLVASRGDQTFDYSVCFAPGERLTAVLTYEQVLLKQRGWHEYVLPLEARSHPARVIEFSVQVDITASAGIEELVAGGYEDITETSVVGSAGHVLVSDQNLTPNETLSIRWRTDSGPPAGVLYYGEHAGSGYFLHVYDPDPELFGGTRLGKDFVFVLDRSGSMKGTKLEQAKAALGHIYGTLGSGDRFSFVEFDSTSRTYSETLIPVTETTLAEMMAHIRELRTGGSTDIHAGLMDALDIFKADGDSVPVVVLLSDGQANSGLYHRSSFRQDVMDRNTVDAPIYSIVLGADADWGFLEALSLENHGRAVWIGEDEDIVERITDFVGTFSSPLAARLRFDYGGQAVDVHPAEVRAHYEGSEVLVAGRLVGDVTEIPMMLTAVAGSGAVEEGAVFPVEVLPSLDNVPRFWAFSRIQDLEEQMKYNGTDDATVREMTDLAIEFHFVTEYTSLYVELPEDIQERFDNSTAIYDAADSSDYPAQLHTAHSLFFCAIPPTSTADPGGQAQGTTTIGQQTYADSNTKGSSTQRTSSPGTSDSLDGSAGDVDYDCLGDGGDGLKSSLHLTGDNVAPGDSMSGPLTNGDGRSSECAMASVLPGAVLAVLVMVGIPLLATISCAVHWFTVGRKRRRGGV